MTTLRRRLLLFMLPTLAVLMLAGGLVDYWIAVATTQDAWDQALASTAFSLAAYVHSDHGRIDFAGPPQASPLMRSDAGAAGGNTLFSVNSAAGELIAGSPQLPGASNAVPGGRPLFRDASYHGVPVRTASLRLPSTAGAALITVAETGQRRSRTQRVMLFGKLMVDFAELDITLLLIWIAIFYGLKPLSTLRAEVEARSPGELVHFEESRVPGELRPVVVAFNRLLELLHDAGMAQRRFVADAAHQMRTPVAGLLAQIELLIQDGRAQVIAPELKTLQRGIQYLSHSANQLLALARADPVAAQQETFQPVDLERLVRELTERHLERADRAGIDIGAETATALVQGDAWLLEDLLGNLIDNALKYTPAGGHVTVRCGLFEGAPQLEVEDDGPGIPESERQRVRERFYRRAGSPGIGCGLGLAIVDEIARVHRANFSIGAGAQGSGSCMRVRFPRPTGEKST